ncbi:MAG: 4-hydroxy-tetrahydrodipicolinate synthase [Myxococcota bacterium]|jgi:4-hydroxy-tetrahydrodipicolinate synthase|nr:4-hydroxy-tetrahydrodipicolinate synthase [Myxococcota bacterium]
MQLKGVHTALVTPFTSAGEVDLDTFATLCERQISAGVHGLVPCGTTGETPTLTREEWSNLVRTAVQVSNGRVPVTAGCGTNDTRSTVENIQQAQELGADAALVVLPYYNKPNAEGHRAHMKSAASPGLPVVAYHVPGRTGQRVSADLLGELSRLPGVVSVKEATGDIGYGSDVIRSTQATILSGDDFTFFPLMCVGGEGVISVVSNVDPRRTVALADAARSSDLKQGRRLHDQLMPLVHYLFSDTNPAPCKAAMSSLGLCENIVRLPLSPVPPPPPTLLDGVTQ